MDHIEIYVSDLNKSREFYLWLLELLDFELFQDWTEGFSYIKNPFYLVFVQTKEKYLENGYNRSNIGLNHLAFKYHNKEKIDRIQNTLL